MPPPRIRLLRVRFSCLGERAAQGLLVNGGGDAAAQRIQRWFMGIGGGASGERRAGGVLVSASWKGDAGPAAPDATRSCGVVGRSVGPACRGWDDSWFGKGFASFCNPVSFYRPLASHIRLAICAVGPRIPRRKTRGGP